MRNNVVRRATILALIVLLSSPARGYAWSEGGHHLIALIAFKLLSKPDQERFVSILEKHPRFKEDFTPPENLPNDEERLNWRIGRAAYWPDVARRQPTYNRPTWHYELGAALVLGDASKIIPPERPGPLPSEATMETQELYISQALTLCTQTLANKHSSDSDRALALCWIGHLVGDSHQPCHAGSLYMEGVFTESDGDRGANRIITKQRVNLHALWDQLLGNDFSLDGTRRRFLEVTTDEELLAIAKKSIASRERLEPQLWLAESRALAVEHVYTPQVREVLEHVKRGLVEKPEEIELSQSYLKNAGRIAQVRTIEAGYRLAAVWREAIQ
jgi:hypothetical protein